MEGLIATDWLKDYDPLFELFDEEMRAGQPFASSATASQTTCDYLASDYYDYNLPASNYSGTYASTQRPVDELSLVLGLDWMSGLELAPSTTTVQVTPSSQQASSPAPSPSRSLSSSCTSSSSCAPSPPATTTTTTTVSSSASENTQCLPSSQTPEPVVSVAPVPVSVVPQVAANTPPASELSENNNGAAVTALKQQMASNLNSNNNQQQQRVFRIQLQNHTSALNAPSNNNHGGISNSLVGSNLVNNGSISGSLINGTLNTSSTTPTSALKRKRRCMRTKGTSLLAQPSPKSVHFGTTTTTTSITTNNNSKLTPISQSSYSSTAATKLPLSTLLTISKPTSVAVSAPVQLSQQVLPTVAMPTATTTTTTPSSVTTSNLSSGNAGNFNLQHADHHHYHNQRPQLLQQQQSLKINSRAQLQHNNQTTNLTSLVRTMRYCVQIEHAYSTFSAASC